MEKRNNIKVNVSGYFNCRKWKQGEEVKNKRIQDLNTQIEQQKENYETAIEVNISLNKQIAELKKQVEELQKLIPIEVLEQGQQEETI